jgi:hypothetical protein
MAALASWEITGFAGEALNVGMITPAQTAPILGTAQGQRDALSKKSLSIMLTV